MMQFMALGSLIVGGFLAIRETKIARFIGYSSINQIGYILLGVSCATIKGLEAVFLFMIIYFPTVLLLFTSFFL
jgi:NADH-quinone oxidoreductase subunit N